MLSLLSVYIIGDIYMCVSLGICVCILLEYIYVCILLEYICVCILEIYTKKIMKETSF